MSREKRLDGAVALVTGGNRGIGRGIALALADEGCRVAVNHFEQPELADETVRELQSRGAEALSISGDVRIAADVQRTVAVVVAQFGRLTIMVNNAGVQTWKPLLELTELEWDRVIDTNLKGCFLCTQAAGRQMRNQGGGVIVNIGSGANRIAFASLSSYTASKGGIETFTKVSAVELGPY